MPRAAPSEVVSPDTRTRLLDAAEHLFAENGIARTTLRQITASAGANLAAVNYHFGSKRVLLHEVFARRIQPVNEDRLARLDRVERDAGDEPPPVEDILRAFLTPAFLMKSSGTRHDFLRLMGRAHTEPTGELREVVFAQFGEVVLCFSHAIARALPKLPPSIIQWRLQFAIGAMAFTLANRDAPGPSGPSRHSDAETDEEVLSTLVEFLAAGFRAPAGSAEA